MKNTKEIEETRDYLNQLKMFENYLERHDLNWNWMNDIKEGCKIGVWDNKNGSLVESFTSWESVLNYFKGY